MKAQEQDRFNFLSPDQLKSPPGLPTGASDLDDFLSTKGIPRGGLTSLSGCSGLGATSLWMQMLKLSQAKGGLGAWIESQSSVLNPWTLKQQGIKLDQLFWISPPKDLKQKLWVLSEICSLDLFESITCSLDKDFLKDHQLIKLKRLAKRHQVALIFISNQAWSHHELDLSLHFQRDKTLVLRARHRPTPHLLERRDLYAHTLSEFTSERKVLCG